MQHKKSIIIEGNIAAGKSTILDHLKLDSRIEVIPEPIEKWRDLKGQNLLRLMYTDPKKHAFEFQMYALLTTLQVHKAKTAKPIKIFERSLHSNHMIFARNMINAGNISDVQFNILDSWYNSLCDNHKEDVSVDRIVYLRSDPRVAYQRLKRRNRSEETDTTLAYLEELHKLYDDWLIKRTNDKQNDETEVIVINADANIETNPNLLDIYKYSILQGLNI